MGKKEKPTELALRSAYFISHMATWSSLEILIQRGTNRVLQKVIMLA